MKIISKPLKTQAYIKALKLKGKSVGLVPTMGALHEGHLSLIKNARAQNDITVVSIFVNPAQFGPKEDFSKYPRPFSRDAALCRRAGVDVIFAPVPRDMYPGRFLTYIDVEEITRFMCGASRPGHFRGVATVVGKLFNITMPDRAYFGLKDYQQSAVVKKMAADLNFPVRVVTCRTVREKDGLALSSRNIYLTPSERKRALFISKSLQNAKNLIKCKNTVSVKRVVSEIEGMLSGNADKIDYIEVRDAGTLEKAENFNRKRKTVIAIAAFVGKTRLIDNIVV